MGIFQSLAEKLKLNASKSKEENKRIFFDALVSALEDGELTTAEMDELAGLRSELQLSKEDIEGMKIKAFQIAVNCATADGVITPKEEYDLQTIKRYLELQESEIARNRGTLNKMRVLYEIQKGNLPVDESPGLPVLIGEVAHISQTAVLHEEPSGVGAAHPGTGGLGIYFKKNAPYRMGSARVAPVAPPATTIKIAGLLMVTNLRIVFKASEETRAMNSQITFSLYYEDIGNVTVHTDGFTILPLSGKTRIIRLDVFKDIEIMAMLMSRYINES